MNQQDDSSPGIIQPSAFQPMGSADEKPPQRRNTGRWLLLASALVFAVLMLFLLSARSLQVLVLADAPATVAIDGLALPFGERYLLRPGTYTVRATAPGYHPMETEVTVDDRDSQTLELSLQLLPGLVSINSAPAGAVVLIDGEAAGQTPLVDLLVEAGEHSLQLQAERYLPLDQTLQVTGRNIRQEVELELAPGWAEVSLASIPAGASILVDGEAVGATPAVVEIMGGERQLILQLAGYAHWQKSLETAPGQAMQAETMSLHPCAGIL